MRPSLRPDFRRLSGGLWLPVLVAACLCGAPAEAQVFESVGARALGMAGAFVAVADDGTATYWNPAGLAAGVVVDACAGYGRLEQGPPGGETGATGQEGAATGLCLALPVIGFSYNRLGSKTAGTGDNSTAGGSASRQDLRPRGVGVSSLTTDHYGLTLVQTVAPGVAVGATFRIVRGQAGTGEAPEGTKASLLAAAGQLERQAGTSFDADFGVLASGGPFRVGLAVRNIRRASFESPSGARLGLARQARVGLAWTPGREAAASGSDPRGLVLAFDADLTRTPAAGGDRRQVALGAERWWWGRRLGVRAGARASTVGAARPVAAAGASVRVRAGIFLEAAGTRGHRDGDRGWFVGLRAGL